MKLKHFRLIFPMEGLLPAGVIDLTDGKEDHWRQEHVYQAPGDFEINANYVEELNKKDLKHE